MMRMQRFIEVRNMPAAGCARFKRTTKRQDNALIAMLVREFGAGTEILYVRTRCVPAHDINPFCTREIFRKERAL